MRSFKLRIAATTFQLRLYDARLGRWISPDPYGQYHSPYMAMDNTPQQSVDPDGGCTRSNGEECVRPEAGIPVLDGGGHKWYYDHENGTWDMDFTFELPEIVLTAQTSDHARLMANPIVQAIHKGGHDFMTNEVTLSVMALIAAPFALEAAIMSAPYLPAVGAHIAESAAISRSIFMSNLTTNTIQAGFWGGSTSFLVDYTTNGFNLGKVDYFDVVASSLTGGTSSLFLQSFIDYSPKTGLQLNTDIQLIKDITVGKLSSDLHSKVKIPTNTWLGDRPVFEVINFATDYSMQFAIKQARKKIGF